MACNPIQPSPASYPACSIFSIGDFGGGDCLLTLSSTALTISLPDNKHLATWDYSTISNYGFSFKSFFFFISSQRGPYGMQKYVFEVTPSVKFSIQSVLAARVDAEHTCKDDISIHQRAHCQTETSCNNVDTDLYTELSSISTTVGNNAAKESQHVGHHHVHHISSSEHVRPKAHSLVPGPPHPCQSSPRRGLSLPHLLYALRRPLSVLFPLPQSLHSKHHCLPRAPTNSHVRPQPENTPDCGNADPHLYTKLLPPTAKDLSTTPPDDYMQLTLANRCTELEPTDAYLELVRTSPPRSSSPCEQGEPLYLTVFTAPSRYRACPIRTRSATAATCADKSSSEDSDDDSDGYVVPDCDHVSIRQEKGM